MQRIKRIAHDINGIAQGAKRIALKDLTYVLPINPSVPGALPFVCPIRFALCTVHLAPCALPYAPCALRVSPAAPNNSNN